MPARGVRLARLVLSVMSVMLPLGDRVAEACSIGYNPHTLDPAEQTIDTQPPGTPAVTGTKIARGRGPQNHGCGGSSASSCDDIGTVSFTAIAVDDRTTATMLGYRITASRGHAPGDLFFSGQDVRSFDGVIYVNWVDGATDDQEDLDFDLEVRAIDLAGNVSPQAATVKIRDSLEGCRLAGRRPRSAAATGVALAGLIAAMLIRRRRRLSG